MLSLSPESNIAKWFGRPTSIFGSSRKLKKLNMVSGFLYLLVKVGVSFLQLLIINCTVILYCLDKGWAQQIIGDLKQYIKSCSLRFCYIDTPEAHSWEPFLYYCLFQDLIYILEIHEHMHLADLFIWRNFYQQFVNVK